MSSIQTGAILFWIEIENYSSLHIFQDQCVSLDGALHIKFWRKSPIFKSFAFGTTKKFFLL